MNSIVKTVVALLIGVGIYGGAQAAAEYRPDSCAIDHDHRSHDTSYYNYYPQDNYSRAGSYKGSYATYGRRGGRNDSYGRRGRNDSYGRRGRSNRYDRYRPRSKVVHRQTYRTRWNARIVLVEEIYWTRSGRKQLVCSLLAKGREAHYVPHRRMQRIANRDCSPRARIQYLDY